jgi:hypothetical protein
MRRGTPPHPPEGEETAHNEAKFKKEKKEKKGEKKVDKEKKSKMAKKDKHDKEDKKHKKDKTHREQETDVTATRTPHWLSIKVGDECIVKGHKLTSYNKQRCRVVKAFHQTNKAIVTFLTGPKEGYEHAVQFDKLFPYTTGLESEPHLPTAVDPPLAAVILKADPGMVCAVLTPERSCGGESNESPGFGADKESH